MPATWPEARERLLNDCGRGVVIRWQELAAMEWVLQELADELGEDMTHQDVREGLDHCRRKILDLHTTLAELGVCFVLPDPEEPHMERAREYVPVEKLRTADTGRGTPRDPRASLARSQREELERLEAEWAESVRK